MLYSFAESQNTKRRSTLHKTEGIFALHRKEGGAMVTYSDLIQIGIFLVSLVSLIYEIYKDRK